MTGSTTHGTAAGLRYGALALPLAFAALPLYVVVPNHYAAEHGLPLARLGLLLMAVRLLDAWIDPAFGRLADRLLSGPPRRAQWTLALTAAGLALTFHALFAAPLSATPLQVQVGLVVFLALTTFGHSLLTIVHQAWGARLGGDEVQRTRLVAWREGLAVAGVLVASVLPTAFGLGVTAAVFAVALAAGLLLLQRAPRPAAAAIAPAMALRTPLRTPAFRRLLAIYLLNGMASAIPATLVLFFVRDRLDAAAWSPWFLGCYFTAGALSMPVWLRLVGRFGLLRSWGLSMGLAVAAFAGTLWVGRGDIAGFTAVCLLSGAALGADLALPPALLAGVVRTAGHAGHGEGAYFGWWNLATKLSVALAAGLALPTLQWAHDAAPAAGAPWDALTLAYCVLPCVLKLSAAALLAVSRPRLALESP